MEISNIIKQAKSDIFKELYSKINFYIKRGAKPASLKKYYKNNKRFSELLDDIKNKGINLVKDEKEYQKLVREILNDMLDDFIAKEKDKKENKNMKHIKEFNSFEETNESFMGLAAGVIAGWAFYNFLKRLIRDKFIKKYGEEESIKKTLIMNFLSELKKLEVIPITELNDRYFIRANIQGKEFDVRLFKDSKELKIDHNNANQMLAILSDDQYNEFLKLIKKEEYIKEIFDFNIGTILGVGAITTLILFLRDIIKGPKTVEDREKRISDIKSNIEKLENQQLKHLAIMVKSRWRDGEGKMELLEDDTYYTILIKYPENFGGYLKKAYETPITIKINKIDSTIEWSINNKGYTRPIKISKENVNDLISDLKKDIE
jgi:hypothetical protein